MCHRGIRRGRAGGRRSWIGLKGTCRQAAGHLGQKDEQRFLTLCRAKLIHGEQSMIIV